MIENSISQRRIYKKQLAQIVAWILNNDSKTKVWHISIVFTDNKTMQELNNRFLNIQGNTDVIAFELSDSFESHLTGEVYINLELLPQQAREYHVSFKSELVRLLSHGIYHLLGYIDQSVAQRKKMTHLEDQVLKHFHLYE